MEELQFMNQKKSQWRNFVVKLVITDVDGVLTDGKVVYCDNGSRSRSFSVVDGYGFEMLKKYGFAVLIVSGENDLNIRLRANKLNVPFIHAGKKSKSDAVLDYFDGDASLIDEIYVIGDDVNDVPLMGADIFATPKGSKLSDIFGDRVLTLQKCGGDGAFREFAELVLLSNGIDPYKEYYDGKNVDKV